MGFILCFQQCGDDGVGNQIALGGQRPAAVLGAQGAAGGAVVGENVHLYGCTDCMVHAPGAQSLVLEGLHGSIVSERNGRILICRMSEEQRIRDFEK